MRGVVGLLLLVGCDRKPAEPQPSRPAAAPIAAVVPDAAAPDAPAAAAPDAAPAIPPELAAAPAQVTRRVETGMITTKHDAETFTLQIAGTQALLTIERARGVPKPGSRLGVHIERWEPVSKTQLLGTATTTGKLTKIDVSDGTTTFSLACTAATQAAARAAATRRPQPPRANSEGCGDVGRWDPAGTKRVSVLRCKLPDDFDPEPDHPRHWTNMPSLSFAPAPGLEWVYINDDCVMQGGDWRQIANDGSIAQVRHPTDIAKHER